MKIEIPSDRPSLLRVKATGQVQEFIPAVARAMLAGDTAELVDRKTGQIIGAESARIERAIERAVSMSQNPKPKTRSAR
jgi:hypothetical protein